MSHPPAIRTRRVCAGFVGLVLVTVFGAVSWADPTPAEGVFQPAADCAVATCGTGAALLANGKVLSLSVSDGGAAELFDPSTGKWSATGSCPLCGANTFGLTITALPDGRALVAGGFNPAGFSSPPLRTAYLYDSSAGTWSATGQMKVARVNHTATLLPSGKVLVAGGCTTQGSGCGPTGGDSPTVAAELFDPASGTWSFTDDMKSAHSLQTATLITGSNCGSQCGKVLLVAGVRSGVALTATDIYDPASGSWTAGPPVQTPRFLHSATALRDGRVLATGNYAFTERDPRGEIFDPVAGTWTFTQTPVHPINLQGTSVTLPNGKVLVVSNDTPQLYDPASDSWADFPSGTARELRHIEVLLGPGPLSACGTACGDVLVGGNPDSGPNAELYVPRPTISGVDPTTVSTDGGTITIKGTGLAGVTSVTIAGAAATGLVHDSDSPDTTLRVSAPAHAAGSVDVAVTGPGGTATDASAFAYGTVPPPTAPAPAAGASSGSGSGSGGAAGGASGSRSTRTADLPTAPTAQANPSNVTFVG